MEPGRRTGGERDAGRRAARAPHARPRAVPATARTANCFVMVFLTVHKALLEAIPSSSVELASVKYQAIQRPRIGG